MYIYVQPTSTGVDFILTWCTPKKILNPNQSHDSCLYLQNLQFLIYVSAQPNQKVLNSFCCGQLNFQIKPVENVIHCFMQPTSTCFGLKFQELISKVKMEVNSCSYLWNLKNVFTFLCSPDRQVLFLF